MSGIWGQGGSPQGYAVSVGHFTHFAFTVNFTHYVKTKPDSGFTVKSRTLIARPRQLAVRPNKINFAVFYRLTLQLT